MIYLFPPGLMNFSLPASTMSLGLRPKRQQLVVP